jgi:hypothetical protein
LLLLDSEEHREVRHFDKHSAATRRPHFDWRSERGTLLLQQSQSGVRLAQIRVQQPVEKMFAGFAAHR